MNLEVGFSPRAKADAVEAVQWFEKQRPGLGATFAEAVDQKLMLIADFPMSCQPFRGSLRRAIIHRFSYAVVYCIDDNMIQVVAVMACRRQSAIQQRLRHTETRSN